MRTTNENKRYPQGATIGILLCVLSLLYFYSGLVIVPALTIIGQVYFIYASKLWIKRWVTDWGITLYIAGFYLSPLIMLIQSFWQETNDVFHEVVWWMGNILAVLYYIHIVWNRIKKSAS